MITINFCCDKFIEWVINNDRAWWVGALSDGPAHIRVMDEMGMGAPIKFCQFCGKPVDIVRKES